MSKALDLKWAADPQMEAHFDLTGVHWETKKVKRSEFDIATSRAAQTRFEALIDEDHAITLACDIEQSKLIDRLVCMPAQLGFKGIVIADGLHRERALDILEMPPEFVCEIYFIDTQDVKLRELLARSCNTVGHKKHLTKDQVVRHAQEMMSAYNMSMRELATFFHVKESFLSGRLVLESQRKELRDLCMVKEEMLKDGVVKELARIDFSLSLKQRVAQICTKYHRHVTVATARQMVRETIDANKSAGEPVAIQGLANWNTRLLEASNKSPKSGGEGRHRPTRARFLTHLNSLDSFLMQGNGGDPFTSMQQLDITDPHDAAKIRKTWKNMRKAMETLFHSFDVSKSTRRS